MRGNPLVDADLSSIQASTPAAWRSPAVLKSELDTAVAATLEPAPGIQPFAEAHPQFEMVAWAIH
jgi:hypothetical protein